MTLLLTACSLKREGTKALQESQAAIAELREQVGALGEKYGALADTAWWVFWGGLAGFIAVAVFLIIVLVRAAKAIGEWRSRRRALLGPAGPPLILAALLLSSCWLIPDRVRLRADRGHGDSIAGLNNGDPTRILGDYDSWSGGLDFEYDIGADLSTERRHTERLSLARDLHRDQLAAWERAHLQSSRDFAVILAGGKVAPLNQNANKKPPEEGDPDALDLLEWADDNPGLAIAILAAALLGLLAVPRVLRAWKGRATKTDSEDAAP